MPGQRKRRTNRTTTRRRSAPDWAPRFLKALAAHGSIRRACQGVKVVRSTVYLRRDTDADFAAALGAALEDACDRLEEVARRRAVRKSDRLLQFLLQVHRYQPAVRLDMAGGFLVQTVGGVDESTTLGTGTPGQPALHANGRGTGPLSPPGD